MTNEKIIFIAAQQLAKEGKIAYTGRVYKAKDEAGNEIEVKETEAIHTYNGWQERGYQVQKGEKAIAKFTIWKHSGAKEESLPMADGSEVNYIDKGRMFMKTAAFFKESQVAPIDENLNEI